MARRTVIERAVVFALLFVETALWATSLCAGLRASDFTDPFCRLCFSAIAAAHRLEDHGELSERDLVRRWHYAHKATHLMDDVVTIELETFTEWTTRRITAVEVEDCPLFSTNDIGTPIADKPVTRTVERRVYRRPVEALIEDSTFTRRQIESAVSFLQAHKRRT